MSHPCQVCGDTFEPLHRHAQDCPDCRAWASRPMFGLPADRTLWKQAKRFTPGLGLTKRAALREPAFGVRVDPSATQRVPVFAARYAETVAVPSLRTSSQAS